MLLWEARKITFSTLSDALFPPFIRDVHRCLRIELVAGSRSPDIPKFFAPEVGTPKADSPKFFSPKPGTPTKIGRVAARLRVNVQGSELIYVPIWETPMRKETSMPAQGSSAQVENGSKKNAIEDRVLSTFLFLCVFSVDLFGVEILRPYYVTDH